MKTKPALRLSGATVFAGAVFMWSIPLGMVVVAVYLAMLGARSKITAEELGAAWLKHADRSDFTDFEQKRATQIAHLVLNKFKGRRV